MANAHSFYVDSSVGATFGPVTREQLDAWVREGRVTTACIIRTDQGQTCPAGQMYPELGQPPIAPLSVGDATSLPVGSITAADPASKSVPDGARNRVVEKRRSQ